MSGQDSITRRSVFKHIGLLVAGAGLALAPPPAAEATPAVAPAVTVIPIPMIARLEALGHDTDTPVVALFTVMREDDGWQMVVIFNERFTDEASATAWAKQLHEREDWRFGAWVESDGPFPAA